MENGKLILDACCGSRMFWFDKHNPLALFVDKRSEIVTAKDRDKIRTIEVKPDIIADFTNLPFEDSSFYMVVFDPPHLKTLGKTSWMAKKYGLFGDNPNNPYREDDINNAYKAIEEMEKLVQKVYPDRSGFLKNEEKQ